MASEEKSRDALALQVLAAKRRWHAAHRNGMQCLRQLVRLSAETEAQQAAANSTSSGGFTGSGGNTARFSAEAGSGVGVAGSGRVFEDLDLAWLDAENFLPAMSPLGPTNSRGGGNSSGGESFASEFAPRSAQDAWLELSGSVQSELKEAVAAFEEAHELSLSARISNAEQAKELEAQQEELRKYQEELEAKLEIISAADFSCEVAEMTAFAMVWSLQPFIAAAGDELDPKRL